MLGSLPIDSYRLGQTNSTDHFCLSFTATVTSSLYYYWLIYLFAELLFIIIIIIIIVIIIIIIIIIIIVVVVIYYIILSIFSKLLELGETIFKLYQYEKDTSENKRYLQVLSI